MIAFLESWLLTLISTLSIGLMAGRIAKNVKSAGVIASVLYFSMLIFSGATIPYEVMSEFVQRFVGVFPMTQGIQLMKATFLGPPLEHAGLPVVVMLGVTIVCAGTVFKCFKWE